MENLAGWQIAALYFIIAAAVTFLITLFWGDLDGDPPPLMLGVFWPLLLVLLAIGAPIFALFLVSLAASKLHDFTKEPSHDD